MHDTPSPSFSSNHRWWMDFHWRGWHWPAFNVADICITMGVILMVIASRFAASGRNNAATLSKVN